MIYYDILSYYTSNILGQRCWATADSMDFRPAAAPEAHMVLALAATAGLL